MPKVHRKRGKRHKNNEPEINVEDEIEETTQNLPAAENDLPSWIEPALPQQYLNPEAPFGFCDPDVKAYFRTVDTQLREWQELGVEKDVNEGEDPNAGKICFLYPILRFVIISCRETDVFCCSTWRNAGKGTPACNRSRLRHHFRTYGHLDG
jgi:nucleolar protein 9